MFLNRKNLKEMTDNGRSLITELFGEDRISELASNVCVCWPESSEIEELDVSDIGVKMSHKL